jgi:O-antigen/teichoic acid export membrane protein
MSETISIKKNVAANYLSQIYFVLLSFVMAPVYLSYLGTEAYGLIGFFTMLSGWIQLLDMGLTPTIVRQAALYRGGQITGGQLRSFLRGLEVIFGIVSVLVAAAIAGGTHLIATRWLKVGHLPISDVEIAVAIMGITVPMRWVAGLYRGVMIGFERMTWLATYNIAMASLRFIGVLGAFWAFGVSARVFFTYQFAAAMADLLGAMVMSHHLVGRTRGAGEGFSWAPLRANASFSFTIGFVSTAWVILTQADKLVLSKALPLALFGMFSLAVAASSAINIVGGPVSQALLPRLTKLFAEGKDDGAFGLYGNATQMVCVIVFPAVTALVFLAEPILRAWTGHADIARHAAPILRLYAIGNGASAVGSFAYYIQYARGDVRLHFIGNAVVLVILIPAFIWAGFRYGGVGTGAAWAAVNCLYLLIWVPVIHAKFLHGRHWAWLARDVLPIAVPTLLLGWLISMVMVWPQSRVAVFACLGTIGLLLLAVSVAGSPFARMQLSSLAKRYQIRSA